MLQWNIFSRAVIFAISEVGWEVLSTKGIVVVLKLNIKFLFFVVEKYCYIYLFIIFIKKRMNKYWEKEQNL